MHDSHPYGAAATHRREEWTCAEAGKCFLSKAPVAIEDCLEASPNEVTFTSVYNKTGSEGWARTSASHSTRSWARIATQAPAIIAQHLLDLRASNTLFQLGGCRLVTTSLDYDGCDGDYKGTDVYIKRGVGSQLEHEVIPQLVAPP